MRPIDLPHEEQFQKNHFTMLTVLLACAGLAYVAFLVSNWTGFARPQILWSSDQDMTHVDIGHSSFAIPKAHVVADGNSTQGARKPNELRLAATWPSMTVPPRLRALKHGFDALPPDILSISIMPATRQELLYSEQTPAYRSLARRTEANGPGGLKSVTTSSGLSQATTEVYFDPNSDHGFSARCTQRSNTATWCTHKFFTYDGLAVSYSFSKHLLVSWQKLDHNVKALISSFRDN